jgi:mRNA-degrading endonuclease toxin of MazEF toxin-antitoxin module
VRYPTRGEVWLVDLGMTAKVRPCLVVSSQIGDADRALLCLVPHTTSTRQTSFEAVVNAPFLKTGAFDAQGLVTVSVRHGRGRAPHNSRLQRTSARHALRMSAQSARGPNPLNRSPLDAGMIMQRWLLLMIIALLVSCGPTGTPLHLEPHETFVRVHVEFLGEYPSDIALIELRRLGSELAIWRLEPVDESFQLHNFDLRAGQNAKLLPARGEIRAVAPRSASFILEPNTPYKIRVCAAGWYKRCAEKTLVLPASASNSALQPTPTRAA